MKITKYIDEAVKLKKYKSRRQFFIKLGIDQQNYTTWKNNAVPNDKILYKIAEMINVTPLELTAVAKSHAKESTDEVRAYWAKIARECIEKRLANKNSFVKK